MFKPILLARRRIDFVLIAVGFAALAVLNPAGKVIFAYFALGGMYLVLGRHRVGRLAPPLFSAALVAYCAWQIGLSLIRGEPVAGNRLLSYASIELAVVFVPLGMSVVARPVDAMILGARVGVLLLAVAAATEFLLTGERIGLGSNEAILAFVGACTGLFAGLAAERPARFLPNGRWWFYLSVLPVALTQTRAAWLVYVLVLVLDVARLVTARGEGAKRSRKASAAIVAASLAVLVPVGTIVFERFERGVAEIERFRTTGDVVGSVDVRLVMWASGLEVLAEHPLTGVGATRRVAEVGAVSGENAYMVVYYNHLHNLFLDEALSSGLVGVALMLGVFAAFLASVWKGTDDPLLRQTALAFLFLVFSFGFFHGVLLNEWMIIVTFGFMSIVLTQLRRRALAQRRRAV